MKDIILRDAKMCAYAAGNVEHFKYLMKRLGYVFKKDAWMEVQAPGFRYYHKLAKLDECFLKICYGIMWICPGWQSLTFIRRISGDCTGRSCHHSRRVLCKAIQIKGCRTEAFCSWWSKVCRGFEEVSSVTG